MSETADVAEFEAARTAAMAEDDGHDEQIPGGIDDGSGEDGGHDEPPAKDWAKIAQDKEAALAAERSRRKSEAKRARDLEERLARLEQSGKTQTDPFEDLAARLRDDDEDPIGDINGLKQVVRHFLEAQKADREQEAQRSQSQRAFQSITSSMEEAEADFAADHPDYYDAAKHYRSDRQAELEALGYAGENLQRALAQDLIGLVQRAVASGRDPAEAVYSLAKRRGFASGAAQAEDKLGKLTDAAQAGARPAGGKPAGSGQLTAGSISNLSGAAFDQAFQKLRAQQKRAR